MLQAVSYLRVSTKEQTVGSQRQAITDYCARNSIELTLEYADENCSGAKTSRPMLDRMICDMRSGQFSCIIIFRLDRLGRSLGHLLQVFEELRKRRVRLISVADNIDTADDSPTARAFFSLLGIFSQLEREIIVERVNAGLAKARQEGKRLGRPVGSKDKTKRPTSGYKLRYIGRTKDERKTGSRVKR